MLLVNIADTKVNTFVILVIIHDAKSKLLHTKIKNLKVYHNKIHIIW